MHLSFFHKMTALIHCTYIPMWYILQKQIYMYLRLIVQYKNYGRLTHLIDTYTYTYTHTNI